MAYNSFFRAWRKEKKKTKNTLIDFIGMYFQSQWVCESLHQCFFLMFQICSKGIWKGTTLMAIWEKNKIKSVM
jgi:hypothetical protein